MALFAIAWWAAGAVGTVNILPPVGQWDGQFKLDGNEPHASDWIVYLDGEEYARARSRQDIEVAVTQIALANAS